MCSLDARSPCVCIQILRLHGHKSQLLATYWDNFAFNPSLHECTTANDIWQFRIGILKNPAVDLTLQYQGLHTFVHGTDMYASTVVHKGTAYWGESCTAPRLLCLIHSPRGLHSISLVIVNILTTSHAHGRYKGSLVCSSIGI